MTLKDAPQQSLPEHEALKPPLTRKKFNLESVPFSAGQVTLVTGYWDGASKLKADFLSAF
ncbi:MAG: hypothetical protein UX35_C0016G0001 [Microgenomates group bacterium GW2011_GWA1_46_15]|nr:MAG: hypothetical protein UX00_C0015G0001 [Microgenomates group bacterium GW2011_GWB1_45_17]KKU22757.1 MAG: hypothetical protein UX35_C0016G0001 [Microgenomates group bacterium GW2011_GWA1_46_15]KKU24018.1 MAG: hypothetical protein UX36_C0002G0001 [Microgenomates group bacterium GW2011_GWC1_46_15]